MMKNSPGKWTPPSGVVLLALAKRQVTSATVEPKSHLTLPLPGALAIMGSELWRALLFESVSEYISLVA
jgi:hypothetical protein